MPEVFNSGKNIVTGSVTASLTPVVKTVTVAANVSSSNAALTIGTVPASKKWSILSLAFSLTPTGANQGSASLQLNGVNAISLNTYSTATVNTSTSHELHWVYGQCPVLAATQKVESPAAGTNLYRAASVSYIEEDA